MVGKIEDLKSEAAALDQRKKGGENVEEAQRAVADELALVEASFKEHDDKQRIQRAGMNELRERASADPNQFMWHMDAKSVYKFPYFPQEPRGVPGVKFELNAMGESSLVLISKCACKRIMKINLQVRTI